MDRVREGQDLIADSLGFQHPHAVQFFHHGLLLLYNLRLR
jgi:hypothetical protein